MKKTTLHTIIRIGTAAALLVPVAALALVAPTPPITGQPVTGTSLSLLINSIVQFLITISVVVAVGYLIWGGLQFVRGDVPGGKATMLNGVIGVAIILGVGLILSTVGRLIATQSIG